MFGGGEAWGRLEVEKRLENAQMLDVGANHLTFVRGVRGCSVEQVLASYTGVRGPSLNSALILSK